MFFFLSILLLALLFSFNKSYSKNLGMSLIIVVIMVLLNGLRGLDVGQDTQNYYLMYANADMSGRIEPLFRILVLSLRWLGLSYNAFLCIVAFLIYFPIYGFIRKWSLNPCLSIVVYMTFSVFFFQNSFNVLRNAIAASFLLWGIGYLEDGKVKKAIVPSIIAVGFHYSTLIALPFIILAKYTKQVKGVIPLVLLGCSVVVGLSSTFYENTFTMLLQQLSLLDGDVSDNYSKYLSDIAETKVNANGIIMLMAPFTMISLLSFTSKKISKTFRMVFFYGTFLGNILVSVLYTYRLTLFMTLTALILIPQLCKESHPMVKLITYGVVVVMASYFIYGLINETTTNILPYHFCF